MAKVFEITDALPNGTYELLVEVVDAAGNKLVEESSMSFLFWNKTEEDKKTEEQEKEDKLENKLEDKKETEKQEDTKVEIPLRKKTASCSNSEKEEKVNDLIKEPLKEKEKLLML